MPEPQEALLTIGEIAARARHLAADPYAFAERCRHWARLGLLQAVKQVGEGSGRHALFSQTESYMAAVITALAETGLQPAASRPAADARSIARRALAHWLGGRAKGRPQAMVLEITFYAGGSWDMNVRDARQKPKRTAKRIVNLKARGFDSTTRLAMTAVTVNLGELFASVEQRIKVLAAPSQQDKPA